MTNKPLVEVLMTSYNHARYVAEQVNSILTQTWDNISLTVSDNGSKDGSWEILKRFEDSYPTKVKVVKGPGTFPGNHFSLVEKADPKADWYAWCDSDDIWLPRKIEQAMELVGSLGEERPVLYVSRVQAINELDQPIRLFRSMNKIKPSFGHSLAQPIGIGPTMIFNHAAKELIALGKGKDLDAQDWFAYKIIIGAGGIVVYDPRVTVLYRRHMCGKSREILKSDRMISKVKHTLTENYKIGIGKELYAIYDLSTYLTDENKLRLSAAIEMHECRWRPFHRVKLAWKAGLRRQSIISSIFLYALAAFGRL